MTRPADWTTQLSAYLEAARVKPFSWGAHDCVSFCADWARLMTGHDAYARWRGQYSNKAGAARKIAEAGANDMIEAGDILFGRECRVPRNVMIQRGDIALAEGAFGIVTGQYALFLTEGLGLAPRARASFQAAWSVS